MEKRFEKAFAEYTASQLKDIKTFAETATTKAIESALKILATRHEEEFKSICFIETLRFTAEEAARITLLKLAHKYILEHLDERVISLTKFVDFVTEESEFDEDDVEEIKEKSLTSFEFLLKEVYHQECEYFADRNVIMF